MRLVAIVELLFVKSLRTGLFFLFLFLAGLEAHAQTVYLKFENTPLSEALLDVAKNFNVKVAFDAQKLYAIVINEEIRGNNAEECFDKLLVNTGFEFQLKHGNYLISKRETTETPSECRIIGSVSDSETGEQLPFASIFIPESNLNSSATSSGTFYIKHLVSNTMHLNISYIGYYAIDTMLQCKSPIMNCDFKLVRKYQAIDMVVVNEPKVEMVDYRNDVDFATTINASKLIDLPMAAETDIFKALQLLPGISYSENSSELSIRGGSGDQNLVLYDGQTLYNLSHYYGLFSSLNPNIIKDIQVYKGGYDSRYGERVSGIVDITGKSGNQLKPTVYGDVNLISGNLAAEIPLSKKLTLVAAVRRSYTDVYKTELASNIFESNNSLQNVGPQDVITESKPSYFFFDFNAKLTYRISSTEDFSFGAYGGKDHYDNTYSSTNRSLSSNSKDVNNWTNYGFNAAWQKQWNSAFFTKVQAGMSGYSNITRSATVLEDSIPSQHNKPYLPKLKNNFNIFNQNKLNDASLSFRNTWYASDKQQVNFGLLLRYNSVFYYKDVESAYIYDNTNQNSLMTSFYMQDRMALTQKLTIKPGLRLSFYNGNNKLYFEPRFAASYSISKPWSVRLATGRFYQFISQAVTWQESSYTKNLWVLSDDTVHPVLQSDHFIVGTSFELGNFYFDVEAYYKNYKGIQEYMFISPFIRNNDFGKYFPKNGKMNADSLKKSAPPVNPADTVNLRPSYFIAGSGQSYGIDFSVRFKKENFTSWLSYSISKSIQHFPSINNNQTFAAPNDQTHQLNWTNMLSLGKWNFGITNVYSTGKPYISSTTETLNLPTTRTYNRLPNYYRTDISANYNFRIKNVRLKTGATIINLFDTQNYYDINTRKFDFENTSFSETNVIAAQGLSLNLFVHFVF